MAHWHSNALRQTRAGTTSVQRSAYRPFRHCPSSSLTFFLVRSPFPSLASSTKTPLLVPPPRSLSFAFVRSVRPSPPTSTRRPPSPLQTTRTQFAPQPQSSRLPRPPLTTYHQRLPTQPHLRLPSLLPCPSSPSRRSSGSTYSSASLSLASSLCPFPSTAERRGPFASLQLRRAPPLAPSLALLPRDPASARSSLACSLLMRLSSRLANPTGLRLNGTCRVLW
mmetsp:Transcript_14882/g.46617  ORF Transcript_14882/g.46617 Transcript_14882/m.46617 type:complete len:223 (-) Transcript_14882:283-951(-)